jgi:DNA repair protein RadA/Sms
MATIKKQFICDNCGTTTPRWQGKCPNCGEWNTLKEQNVTVARAGNKSAIGSAGKPQMLSEVSGEQTRRFTTGMAEFDEVLGGGMVPGSLILLGGDPGIGKSTLALQLASFLAGHNRSVLYISGEESAQQIKMRNTRLSSHEDLPVMPETDLETVIATMAATSPDAVIIDSIQTLNSQSVNGVVGGVSQLSYATNALMRVAKENNIATVLIGHVTKEGMLAGPKTIEHMVDVVLYLEGERFGSLRLLRSAKNRFGSVGEVGVFDMREEGLVEVANPSALFLEHRDKPLAGSCTTAILEGNKVMLLEVQALTSTTSFGYPKRTTSGFDVNRLQLIIAILQRSLKVNLSNQDIYINVAGGFKIEERAADLPVALAILSSFSGNTIPADSIAFGEIGLLGEVRKVSQSEKRTKEAKKLGFKSFITSETVKSVSKLNSVLKLP